MNNLIPILLSILFSSCGIKVITQDLASGLSSGSQGRNSSSNIELVTARLPGSVNPVLKSRDLSVSSDGRFIAFSANSGVGNIPEASDGSRVYLKDTLTGVTELISKTSSPIPENGLSTSPIISGDGSMVVFYTSSTNLDITSGTFINGSSSMVVFDRNLRSLKVVLSPFILYVANEMTNNWYAVSTNGKRIAFLAYNSDLVTGDTNASPDAFIYYADTDSFIRISKSSNGTETDGVVNSVSISGDGLFATFTTNATNLDPAMTDKSGNFFQGYIHNLTTGTTVGININAQTDGSRITNGGTHVLIQTRAANLGASDTNLKRDVYRYEVSTDSFVRLSLDQLGQEISVDTFLANMSPDGSVYQLITDGERLTGAGLPGQTRYLYTYNENNSSTYLVNETSSYIPFLLSQDSISSLSMTATGESYVISSTNLNLPDDAGRGMYKKTSSTITPINVPFSQDVGTVGYLMPGRSISADGRYITFESPASNLVTGDTNNATDVFVRDLQLGTTTRVSVDSSGLDSDYGGGQPSITPNGRFILFFSSSTNLVANDTNGMYGAFVRDLQLGTTTRVSVDSAGVEADYTTDTASISPSGRFVAFSSYATNLVSGDTNDRSDIFVRDLMLGTTTRVSVDSAGLQTNYDSSSPDLSSDGRYISFVSEASNLVANDTNGNYDVFVRDLQLGTTLRASVDNLGSENTEGSGVPIISDDGRYVSFYSNGAFTVEDTNGVGDLYIRDLQLGSTFRVPVNSSRQALDLFASYLMSKDGRYIVFTSQLSNLVAGDTNGFADVFVRDLELGTTIRVSVNNDKGELSAASINPSISDDGAYVTFQTNAKNTMSGIYSNQAKIYRRKLSDLR